MRAHMTPAALATLALLAGPVATAAALPSGNLLQNPGFEQGPTGAPTAAPPPPVPGWASPAPQYGRALRFVAPGTGSFYRTDLAASAGAGCRGFVGAATPRDGDDANAGSTDYFVQQDVAIPAEAAGAVLRLGGLFGRYGTGGAQTSDYAGLSLQFLGSSGAVVGSAAAVSIDNFSMTPASSEEYTRHEGTARVPSGATTARVFASSDAVFEPMGEHAGPANGLVDDVKLTFDPKLPADPAPGCQAAAPTTGEATAVTTQAAIATGSIDTKHEAVAAFFRYGKDGALDQRTGEVAVAAADTPQTTSAQLAGLDAGSTYAYVLVARTAEAGGEEVRGAVRTFTTATSPPGPGPGPGPGLAKPLKPNAFKDAVRVSKPKGGCVKPGTRLTVSVGDKAEGVRRLTRFVVSSSVGRGKAKRTVGPVGTSSSQVTVAKLVTKPPPGHRGGTMTLAVLADFAAVVDPLTGSPIAGSADSVSGRLRFPLCRAAKRRSQRATSAPPGRGPHQPVVMGAGLAGSSGRASRTPW